MQLRSARLCLDCEEIHEEQQCPVCASEMFAFLTRWVPVENRRIRRWPTATNVTPEKSGVARWAQRSAIGLGLLAAGRWLWQSSRPAQPSEAKNQPTEQSGRQAKGPPKIDA
jgi:hypothetical protein